MGAWHPLPLWWSKGREDSESGTFESSLSFLEIGEVHLVQIGELQAAANEVGPFLLLIPNKPNIQIYILSSLNKLNASLNIWSYDFWLDLLLLAIVVRSVASHCLALAPLRSFLAAWLAVCFLLLPDLISDEMTALSIQIALHMSELAWLETIKFTIQYEKNLKLYSNV